MLGKRDSVKVSKKLGFLLLACVLFVTEGSTCIQIISSKYVHL